jgi:hypothetical protein
MSLPVSVIIWPEPFRGPGVAYGYSRGRPAFREGSPCAPSARPILFSLARDCRRLRVFGLDPARAAGDQPKAIVLDLMQPTGSARRLFRRGQQTSLDRADAATRHTFTLQNHCS